MSRKTALTSRQYWRLKERFDRTEIKNFDHGLYVVVEVFDRDIRFCRIEGPVFSYRGVVRNLKTAERWCKTLECFTFQTVLTSAKTIGNVRKRYPERWTLDAYGEIVYPGCVVSLGGGERLGVVSAVSEIKHGVQVVKIQTPQGDPLTFALRGLSAMNDEITKVHAPLVNWEAYSALAQITWNVGTMETEKGYEQSVLNYCGPFVYLWVSFSKRAEYYEKHQHRIKSGWRHIGEIEC